jgi:hypothetical protein
VLIALVLGSIVIAMCASLVFPVLGALLDCPSAVRPDRRQSSPAFCEKGTGKAQPAGENAMIFARQAVKAA